MLPRPTQDTHPFALPASLSDKLDPDLIGTDRAHFAAIASSLEHAIADLEQSLAETRRDTARYGTAALERDQEVHRLTARLRALRRFDLDLCLGRIVHEDRPETHVHRPLRPRRPRRSTAARRLALAGCRAVLRRHPRAPARSRQPSSLPLDQRPDLPDPGTPHNLARDDVWEEVLTILADKLDSDELSAEAPTPQALRIVLDRHGELRDAFDRAWPLIAHTDLVGDLWTVPAYLRRCAPWLEPDEVEALRRPDPEAWTYADLPLLDAARLRLGDPEASRRRRRTQAAAARERARMSDVIDDLRITARESGADEFGDGLVTMLVHDDLQSALVDDAALPTADADLLAGPFAHVVVDEAQELTDAEWRMLLRRCPSRSLTIVGDRAQARHGFAESWTERLARIGLPGASVAPLTANYRTPAEVMAEAEPVIRAVLPEANVPTSIRESGVPVLHAAAAERDAIIEGWLAEHAEGTVVVTGDPTYDDTRRVRSLTPELAKDLEFDLVVLVDPNRFGEGVTGAVDRYVAMTRATQRLVVLTSGG